MENSQTSQLRRLTPLRAGDRTSSAELDLVIPALNEEARIEKTIKTIDDWARSRADIKLILVDNGSADATAECVDRANAKHLPVEVVSCRFRGKGAAVRSGVLRSRARYVGYCDADLATPVTAIDPALALLREGFDVVLGSRHCPGAAYAQAQPLLRRSGGWCFRQVARRYVGQVTDTQCGFKLFTGPVARSLFLQLSLTGFAFDVEIVALAQRQGHRVVELPVTWSDQRGSTFRPLKDGLSSFRDLIALRQRLAGG